MAKVGAALAGAREEVAPRFPAASRLDAEFSGGYALAVECEAVVRRDLTRNLTLSVVLVVAFLLLAWRRVGLVTAAGWSLALGLLIGFGLFSAIRREIVSLALVGGALLAAAGIDYAIHVIRPLCVARGRISRRAVVASCAASARPLALAALTTVAAFLALCVSGEALLRDLGLLTACGIAAAFLSALVLLPACLALCVRRRRGAKPRRGRALRRRPRAGLSGALAALAARRPGLTVAIASLSALASAACVISSPPRVLPDLRGIHSARSGALEAERRLKETFAAADEPALVIIEAEGTGEAPEDAALDALLRFERELAALAASEGSGEGAGEDRGLVLGWSSALRIVPAPAEERAVLEVLARKDPDALDAALEGALAAHGFAPEAFAAPRGALRALLSRRVPLGVEGFRRVEGLAGFDRLLARRGGSGFALVAIHPRGSLWESEEKSRLVSAIHGALERAVVRGEVTGLHLAAAASSRHVVTEFLEATGIALIAVAVIVILLLRGALSLAALVPVGLSCLWTGAAWSLLGLDLHFMNVSVLPMVLGIGVDDGIHLVARYSRRPSADVPSLYAETGSAVVLTTVTTLAAFGTLAFSENRGLASVGFLAVFGISSALLASLLVLPALLELDRRRRARGAGRGGGPGSRCGS
jgi:predicted RND superfamily exporter protein